MRAYLSEQQLEKASERIQRGHTLTMIAKQNRCSVETLKKRLELYNRGIVLPKPAQKELKEKPVKRNFEFVKSKVDITVSSSVVTKKGELKISPYVAPLLRNKHILGLYVHKNAVSADKILEVVLGYFGVTEQYVFKKTRKDTVRIIRQILQYFLRERTRLRLKAIGEFGWPEGKGQDHTTVINSIRTINNYLTYDEHIQKIVQDIHELINS
jgi:chromosomal replication initiation ATPase DnaA